MNPPPSLTVRLSPEDTVKVTSGFTVKTAPESIVIETPGARITLEVKVVSSVIIHGSSISPRGSVPI